MTQQYPPQQPPGGGYGPRPPQPPQQPPYGQQPPQQPYGQQQPPRPPQQPPYGQPVGGPGTPPGAMPSGGMPPQTPPGGTPATPSYPPTPKKSKTRLWVTLAVLVVVIGGLVFYAIQKGKVAPSSAAPGDCIKVNSQSADDADVEKIDCTSQDAVYKVGVKLDSATADCPTDSYITYTQTGKGDDFALCLMLNTKEGECFADLTTQDPNKRTTKVECTAANAEGKVTKVVNGKAEEKACPADTGLPLVYPQPAPGLTVCVDPVAAGQGS